LLKNVFIAKGISVEGLFIEENYQTPVKNRFMAESQQLIRIDFEKEAPLNGVLEKRLIEALTLAIDRSDIVAISDYGKGVLSEAILTHIIRYSKKKGIPVIVDPKGEDFQKYAGATMIKPNSKEAYAAAKCGSAASIEEVAREIFSATAVDMLLITRSEKGMSLFDRQGKESHFPVVQKEVKDVTGAGDTALAMITFAYANTIDLDHAITLANIASGLAIEKVGCVSITLSEIATRLLQIDTEGKIFDERYLFVLAQALKGKRVVLLHLEGQREFDQELFDAIRHVRELNKKDKLIVYISIDSNKNFISFLSSLPEIDFIVMESESLEHFCSVIPVEKIYTLDNVFA